MGVSHSELEKTDKRVDSTSQKVDSTAKKVDSTVEKVDSTVEKVEDFTQRVQKMEENMLAKYFANKQEVIRKLARSPNVKMTDVVGLQMVKMNVDVRILNTNKSMGRILLFGPSGCGKTYITEGVATDANLKFIQVKPSEVLADTTDNSLKFLKSIFEEAKKRPCVLFFDEFDAHFVGDVDRVNHLTAEFKILMDLLRNDNGGVIFFAATNNPHLLPDEIRARFSFCFYFPLPTVSERRQYIAAGLTSHYSSISEDDLDVIVKGTDRFCYRDLWTVFHTGIPAAKVMKITNSLYFKKQLINDVPKFVPCTQGEERAQTIDKTAERNNIEVEVNLKLLQYVISLIKPQTSPEHIQLYESYADKFGAVTGNGELPF